LRQLEQCAARAKELGALAWFNRALEQQMANEEPDRRAKLALSGRLADAQATVRRNIVQRSAERLAVALGRKDERDAQATLDDLAKLTQQRFSLTADDLLRERDLDAFLSDLVTLGIRPANESDRASRADLIMVETMRGNFSSASDVELFLGRSYREWADEAAQKGRAGLALYLEKQARAAGAATRADFEAQSRDALAKNFHLTVHLAPTEQKGTGLVVNDTWHDAVRDILTRTAASWIKVDDLAGEEKGGFTLQPQVTVAAEEHGKRQFTWNVHYQSGTRNDRNPDYDNLAAQLQSAQNSYNEIRNAAAQAKAQSDALANSGNVFGALMGVAANAYSDASVQEAANRVNQLNNQLARTAAYTSTPIYADEAVPVTVHSVNQAAALELKLLDGTNVLGSAHWDANLRYTTREWPASPHASVAARTAALVDPGTAGDRLGRDLGAKVTTQSYGVLQPIAGALFKFAEQKLGEATPLEQAEFSWSLVELWDAGGVSVADRMQREAAVRHALGLPVTSMGARGVSGGRAWQNSLGQRLVPVAGTSVLFSTWETRVQDFEAFVSETGHDAVTKAGVFSIGKKGWEVGSSTWKSPGFAQDPAHPVTCVNRLDAEAFCAWLTKKERAAGLIGPNQSYRLPTDAEWSAVAGLVNEPGATPHAKEGKVPGFGWGTDWPPVAGAGSLAGFEVRDLPWWPDNWAPFEDVGDGYPATAPVGMFSANANGLYDIEGNVQEWCGDAYEPGSPKGVLRGGCFSYNTQASLALSDRSAVDVKTRFTVVGFRVVLDLGNGGTL
jgi:formylglycine-generating enzyme required for sulfatase activity